MEQTALIGRMTADEIRVAKIITKCRGRARAITARQIAYKTGIDGRRVRDIIKALVEEQHMAVGSSPAAPAGYYIITDPAELRQVRRSLVGRAVSILNRARAYDRAGWVKEMAGQLSMRLEADQTEEQYSLFEGGDGHA